MLRRLSRLAFAILVTASAPAAAFADAADDLFRAEGSRATGNYDAAIALYTQSLDAGTLGRAERAAAYLGRGLAYASKPEAEAQSDKAFADFSEAIAIDPAATDAYYNRALVSSNLGNYAAALADFATIESAAANYPDFHFFRAYFHLQREDYDEAIADLDVAIAAAPDSALAYFRRGRAYASSGRPEMAVADFSKALDLKPADPILMGFAHRWRGTALFALKRYDAAVADFDALIAANPKDADAVMRKAGAHYESGRYEDAVADTSRLIRDIGPEPQVFPWPGIIQPDKPFADRVVEQYNSGMDLPGHDPFAYLFRARSYFRLGDQAPALADYESALKLIPAGVPEAEGVRAEMEQVRAWRPPADNYLLGALSAAVAGLAAIAFWFLSRRNRRA